MARPTSVTPSDAERWLALLVCEATRDAEFRRLYRATDEPEQFQELFFAGCWLTETLREMGCSPLVVETLSRQNARVQVGDGANPWDAAKKTLEDYRLLMEALGDDSSVRSRRDESLSGTLGASGFRVCSGSRGAL